MHAVILAGGPLGRDIPLQDRWPRSFWPILLEPILVAGIRRMVAGGVHTVTLCANGRTDYYAERLHPAPLHLMGLHFSNDVLPRGSAGCIRDAVRNRVDETFLVANAASWFTQDLIAMVRHHRHQGNSLTVFCEEGTDIPRGLYLCEPSVLDLIPDHGFYDMKEQLIPQLHQRGWRVGLGMMKGLAGEVIDAASYLDLHHRALIEAARISDGPSMNGYYGYAPGVWIAPDAEIAGSARLYGPVIIGPRARIGKRAVVVGPTTIGADAEVGSNAVLITSAVWPTAQVSAGATLEQVIVSPQDDDDSLSVPFSTEQLQSSTA